MYMLITRQEKEKLVIKLAEEGKTTRDIAKEVHISLQGYWKNNSKSYWGFSRRR